MYNGTIINPSPTIIAAAGAAITAGPFTAVAFDAAGKFVTATKNSVPVGILVAEEEKDIAIGDEITAQVKEMSVWKTGAAVAAGDLLASDDAGLAIKATEGLFILAVALEAADAAGQVIKVQITKSGYAK
ncbi:MAG: DUF2190 family protein [Schwartzia sp.]|nr:DUF2190 family protein [Schwartzia sp. (in: firmicutes)]